MSSREMDDDPHFTTVTELPIYDFNINPGEYFNLIQRQG